MGKSFLTRIVAAFCVIYIPFFTKIKEKWYTVAWCCPNKRLAIDHVGKLKPYIKRAVELFNMENPENPLMTKDDSKSIKENRPCEFY